MKRKLCWRLWTIVRSLSVFVCIGVRAFAHEDHAANPAAGTYMLSVVHLRVELLDHPQGIDVAEPLLSWEVASKQRAQIQTAYRIVVADSPEALDNAAGLVWDSGKVMSSKTLIRYGGRKIASAEHCYWKVMSWDGHDQPSAWSDVSDWSAGLLHPGDWKGSWIGADVEEDARTVRSGYQAQPTNRNQEESITIDLHSTSPIDTVVLYPAVRIVGLQIPGYGFPPSLRVESSKDGEHFQRVAAYKAESVDGPGYIPVSLHVGGARARLVRITAEQLWKMTSDDDAHTDVPYRFALGRVEVISGGKNVASNASAFADSSLEDRTWGLRSLLPKNPAYAPGLRHAGDAEVLLGRRIQINKPIRRAMAYFSGLGYGVLEIDGQKVGDRELEPGHTDYTRRVLYSAYDVTSKFSQGCHLIGIRLGNGWFHLPSMDIFGGENTPWTAPPQAILNIRVEYADGSRETFATDSSWQWGTSEVTYNSIRGGETIDWSRPTANWKNFGAVHFWSAVREVSAPAGTMHGQEEQPVRVLETVKPVRITEPVPNVFVFDFGIDMAGTVRFAASGEKGQKVTLEFNEQLKPDGTVDITHEASHHTYGRFQTGELILSGGPRDVFDPHYTYHGFQYVQVSGLKVRPSLNDIEARILETDSATTGSFHCSNEKFNKLEDAIVRTERNYDLAFPNDPLREKQGWTQDVFNDFQMSVLNRDMGPLYRRWFHDMLDAQDADGHEPCIAPTAGWCRVSPDGTPPSFSDVWWGGAIIYLPWVWYQQFGDDSLIREGYSAGQHYLDYLGTTAHGHLLDWGNGDWGDSTTEGFAWPTHTQMPETSSAGYFYLTALLAREARVIGRRQDADNYDAMAGQIRQAFNDKYFDSARGHYTNSSQTSQALPIFIGLVPPQFVATTAKELVASVHAAGDHLRTGFVGLSPLVNVLSQTGEKNLAYTVANQDDLPGWWNMIKDGGTTVSEYWDPHQGSRNIINLAGPLGAWFYEVVAGINIDPSFPGYEHFILKPGPIGDLTFANASIETVRGKVESSWKLEGNRLLVEVSIPANTTATLFLPVPPSTEVKETDGDETGINHTGNGVGDRQWARELESGTYRFEVDIQR